MSAVSCASDRRSTCRPRASSFAPCATTLGSGRAKSASTSSRTAGTARSSASTYVTSPSIANDTATRSLSPVAPLQRGSIATRGAFIAWRNTSSAASASRAITTSTSIVSPAGASSIGVESPSASRMRGSSVRNSSWSNSTHALDVERAVHELARLLADVDLTVEDRHLAVLEHAVFGFAEILALLGRQLVEVLEDAFEGSVGRDQLGGGLLADTGHAGKVVARVAAQCRVLGVLRGSDSAATFGDPRLVVERVVGNAALVVEDLDVRIRDELERVTVAGDDDHVDAVGRGAGRERRDHVVGLDARNRELADRERFDDLVDQRQL